MGPGWPALPIIEDRVKASFAADSMAPYTSELNRLFVFVRAESRMGCVSLCEDVVLLASAWGRPFLDPRFGEPDIVVALVFAVVGRSSDILDIAAPDVAGNLPVNSNRWIRDLRSSSSSHTVEGAAVEAEDSVPSTP
jgi:hypothetical protein